MDRSTRRLPRLILLPAFTVILLLAACREREPTGPPLASRPTFAMTPTPDLSTRLLSPTYTPTPTPKPTGTPIFLVFDEVSPSPTSSATVDPSSATAEAALAGAPRLDHDKATFAAPAPPGTVVVFPGGLELAVVDVIFPATSFLADNVDGSEFQQRLAAEAEAGRVPLVVEWIASCPTVTAVLTAPVCGALLSATVMEQPLVDLNTYEPHFPQVLSLPYGVPAGQARRSYIVSTSIPANETPALLKIVYYMSDAGGIEYATAVFDLR